MDNSSFEQDVELKIYFIPKNVKERFEIFEGFGMREMGITLIFGLIGLSIGLILMLFTQSKIPLLLVVPATAFGVLISRPNPRTGMSALTLIKDSRHYNSRQKKYFYRFGSGR